MTIETATTVVASFPTGRAADRAIAEAISLGLAPGRVGRMEDGHGPVLVSLMLAAAERPATVEALRRLGAEPLLELSEAQAKRDGDPKLAAERARPMSRKSNRAGPNWVPPPRRV